MKHFLNTRYEYAKLHIINTAKTVVQTVKITPPVLIEDHTMHFTPVLNLRCFSSTPKVVILTHLVVILTLFGVMFKLYGVILTPEGVVLY